MFKKQKKPSFNLKIFRLFFITPLLVSVPFSSFIGDAKAGLEFQWDQNTGFKSLKWFQKEAARSMRNKIYFFLRRYDRKAELLKIDLVVPATFKSTLKTKNIKFCKVEVGGFEGRTKCLEDFPADIEIESEELVIKNKETTIRRILIYPYKPLPKSKDSYAIVLKAVNPRRSGLYQFHSYGQYAGEVSSRYLGSWTIVID